MSRSIPALLGLIACGGPSADEFVLEYTDLYCALRVECGDPADLVFEGADTVETCQGTYGPQFEAVGQGCVLKGGPAKDCLAAMEALTCPPDGDVDAAIPPACGDVWQKCEDAAAEPTDPTTEDTGAAG